MQKSLFTKALPILVILGIIVVVVMWNKKPTNDTSKMIKPLDGPGSSPMSMR